MTRQSLLFLNLLLSLVFANSAVTSGQVERGIRDDAPIWFVARVVDVAPFTIEYLDDWYHYQEGSKGMAYEFGIVANPHGVHEKVQRFKIGDLITGETCFSRSFDDHCPAPAVPVVYSDSPYAGVRLPPQVAFKIEKLASKYITRYSTKGTLVVYRPRETGIVDKLTIFRDGKVVLDSSDSWATDKLSDRDLADLQRAFFSTRTDRAASGSSEYSFSFLQTVFERFRYLKLDQSSENGRAFTNRLDRLSERMLDEAEYRVTYRWRIDIKDWAYNEILPIEQAAAPGYRFIAENRERLSKYLPSEQFFEEARERSDTVNRFFYRWKGDLYYFEFPTCTDNTTGSFGCFRAGKAGSRDGQGNFIGPHTEWPASARASLRSIPADARTGPNSFHGTGIRIDKEDFRSNRVFYLSLLGEGGWFREGDAVFVKVKVWFAPKGVDK